MLQDESAGLTFLDEMFARDKFLSVVAFPRTPEASIATISIFPADVRPGSLFVVP